MSQVGRLYNLLSDFEWHRTDEILSRVYGSSHLGIARISARVYDVQKKFGVEIESDNEKGSLWKYRMKKPLDNKTLFD